MVTKMEVDLPSDGEWQDEQEGGRVSIEDLDASVDGLDVSTEDLSGFSLSGMTGKGQGGRFNEESDGGKDARDQTGSWRGLGMRGSRWSLWP